MKTIIKIIIPLAIIGLAVLGFKLLKESKKEPDAKKQIEVITSVEIVEPKLATHSTTVETFGTVRSKFETKISTQVSGKIIDLSPQFRVGKKVFSGYILATLDSTDYIAALAQQQANLTIAQRSLDEEKIRAEQAKQDWIASGRKLSTASDFVLRKPQLSAAQASINATEAVIIKAKADIARTKIRAPFDAIVTNRNVSLGDYSTPQTVLGNLISSDSAEIYLPLTAEQKQQINPKSDTEITLSLDSDPFKTWTATFLRYAPTIDPKNQVSYLIANIKAPYGKRPLPVGSFINASIPAKKIERAYLIPESALVNDSYIWLVRNKDNTIYKRDAVRLHSYNNGNILIKITFDKQAPPRQIITRPLSTFRDGMKVKTKLAQPQ